MKADVSANDCYSLVDTALKRFGNVNGLVNSAGLADRAARCWTPASSSGTVGSHQYARPIPVNEGADQTLGRNRPIGQHRQHPFDGGRLRAILPDAVFGV